MRTVTYAERAAIYELEYTDSGDENLLAQLASSRRSVLEAPSGVGRLTLGLLRPGRRYVAVDIEPNMVRRLRERAAGLPGSADLEVVAADLRSLDLGEEFDLVIVQREAFQMFLDRGDALRILESLRRHLAPGGTLLIDVAAFDRGEPPAPELQPGYFDPELPDGVRREEWTKPLPWGGTVTRHRVQRRPDPGTIVFEFSYDLRGPDGKTEAWSAELRLAIRSRQEMLALAAEAGLAPEQICSDYDLRPDRPGSVRTIFLFRRGEEA